MKMAAIYVSHEANNEESMQKQIVKCTRYADKNNLPIQQIYRNPSQIPASSHVIITSYHRLARTVDLLDSILNNFDLLQINLHTASTNVEDPDILISEILSAIETSHSEKLIII